MSWVFITAALLLLPGRRGLLPGRQRTGGRHRPAVVGRTRRPPLPVLAGVGVLVLVLLLGGRTGVLLAGPAAIGAIVLVRRLSRPRPAPVDRPATAFLLDLLAAVLKTGAPPDQAIEAVSRAVHRCGGEALQRAVEPLGLVGRLLRLGTEPDRAWSAVAEIPGLEPVAAAGRRCADSGARLAGAFSDTADQLRAEQLQRTLAKGQRAGVWALLPLGCCFLPAFVCLGVVPVVIGTAGQVLPR